MRREGERECVCMCEEEEEEEEDDDEPYSDEDLVEEDSANRADFFAFGNSLTVKGRAFFRLVHEILD